MRTRMIVVVAAALALVSETSAQAQPANAATYKQEVFAAGVNTTTGSPVWTNVYQASAAACNQAAPTTSATTVVNPTQIIFDDPANVGRICTISLASTLLSALPNGSGYVTTLSVTDTSGASSVRSAASNPFQRLIAPSTLTNVRVR